MSISPVIISLTVPAVNRLSAIGLNGASGPLLTDPDAHSSAQPVIASRSGITSHGSAAIDGVSGTNGLDPLTPFSRTASDAAALTTVIRSVTSTLTSVQGSSGQSVNQAVSQFLQSQGFLLLFHALGAGDTASRGRVAGSSEHLGSLLHSGIGSYGNLGSSKIAGSDVTKPASTNGPDKATLATGANANPAPYFQRLLGELASTFSSNVNTGGGPATSSSSELDLFLKWLSLYGSSSVVASA